METTREATLDDAVELLGDLGTMLQTIDAKLEKVVDYLRGDADDE